jgi:arylsulfatase A-like enzyme
MTTRVAQSETPNIVFILADDMGQWAMGCSGNAEIRTPNLDALAASGLRFANYFCTSPVCSPARASIMTGQIPSRHGVHDWIKYGNSEVEKRTDGKPQRNIEYLAGLPGYTDVLSQHGYTCGISGKWHMGDSDRIQKGFSYWHVIPANGGAYQNPVFATGSEIVHEEGYQTDLVTDHAIEFLRAQAEGDGPFYLSVHYFAPHAPWFRNLHPQDTFDDYMTNCPLESVPREPMHPWMHNWLEKTGRVYPEKSYPRDETERRERLSGYYTAITEMDRNIGRIVASLDEMGLRENTLLVFTSDNGMNLGQHGIYGKGNGTFPQNMYDTSVKVPMVINRPGHVPEGRVEEGLFSHYDLFPTLVEYAGAEMPRDGERPGRSFAALLAGETCAGAERVVVFDEYGPVRMVRTPDWKYVHRYPYGPHELYDLANDPDERYNLMTAEGMEGKIAEMRAVLEVWFLQYVDPERDGVRQDVTGDGQIERVGPEGQGRRAFDSHPCVVVRGAGLALHRFP